MVAAGYLTIFCVLTVSSPAQTPQARIATEIDNSQRVAIQGSHPPMAKAENDAGRVPASTTLQGMSVVFSRSAAQEADLKALIAAQQDSGSPLYHKWLTPEEFAARFGVADEDITKVQLWLQQQGFAIEGVSRSRNRITFSGTTQQAEAAFAMELHYYLDNGEKQYGPSTDISLPAALSGVVENVTNLSTFRPKPRVKVRTPQRVPRANFTSSQTSDHFLTPGDVATIYDITPAYSAGYTGVGQSIAVVGQSAIAVADIENFESAAGLPKKDPTQILVPNSGTSTIVTGDESESDLDLEYAGAIAKGATIFFVYVGNNANYSVTDSLAYVIDSHTAPIIGTSYGACETEFSASDYASLNGVLAQAATQGQTVVASAGDSGSTDCSGETTLTKTQQEALAVDFPASSEYVTGMGGTEFPAADVVSTNTTYWTPANGTDVISSALSYIPEQVWNDDSSTAGLSAGGGGVSTLTPRPTWQTGVPGIAAGSFRLVPDISLTASPDNAGFLYCSSDTKSTGITGSCANGFRDGTNTYLTVAGGTSFDVPLFVGMVAIINQKLNSTGQGVVNPTLYTLAADPTTYASAFHDITSGNNECTAGPTYCATAGESQYAATTGYDQATGLGSLDFYHLLTAWPASSSPTLATTTTTLSPATTSPASGGSDIITITVAPASSSNTSAPTGTVTVVVDGTTETSSLALVSGSATYTFSSTTAGAHTVAATYSGDSTYAPSTGTVSLTVTSAVKGFALSATPVTVSAGNSGTSTVTVTPKSGYTGSVTWTVTPSIANACFVIPNTTVSGTSAVTSTLTIYTNSTACLSAAKKGASGKASVASGSSIAFRANQQRPSRFIDKFAGFDLAGLLVFGLLGLRSRKPALAAIFFLATIGLAISGCSSGSSSSSSTTTSTTNAAAGTYTLTVTGTDSTSSSVTASTTLTLTID